MIQKVLFLLFFYCSLFFPVFSLFNLIYLFFPFSTFLSSKERKVSSPLFLSFLSFFSLSFDFINKLTSPKKLGVMFLFDCLNDWWKTLKDNSLSLPETFEFDLLLKCFDILIEIDYHVTLGLLFQFLHTHLVSFSAVLSFWKRIVGEKILGSWFFRF